MDSHRDFKPQFIMWDERDFREDRTVQRMTPHQRAMYRNLLMECYYGEDRPCLTTDNDKLWIIAEADSLEDWNANKALIMSKFQPANGGTLLSNKRVLVEWDILIEKLEQKKNAGRASAEARRKRISLDDKGKTPVEEKKEEGQYSTPHHTSTLNGRSTDVQRTLEEGAVTAESSVAKTKTENAKQGDLLERMARSYTSVHGGFLSGGGKQKVLDLRKTHEDKLIERGWNHWLEKRDLEGLKCPLSAFADEFPQVLEAMEKEQDFAAIALLNLEADVIAWAKKLRATAERPSLNSCTRGSDAWEAALCEWARLNPPPVPYFLPNDWRADETLAMEIERARSEYERPEMKSFDLLKMFGEQVNPNAERWPGDLSVGA